MRTGKSDEDYVKLKLRRDTISSTSGPYKFSISSFDDDNRKEYLLFVQNFNMTLAAIGTHETDAKIQYICTLVYGEALRQFDCCLLT